MLSGREQTQGDVAADSKGKGLKSMKKTQKTSENKIVIDERVSRCVKL